MPFQEWTPPLFGTWVPVSCCGFRTVLVLSGDRWHESAQERCPNSPRSELTFRRNSAAWSSLDISVCRELTERVIIFVVGPTGPELWQDCECSSGVAKPSNNHRNSPQAVEDPQAPPVEQKTTHLQMFWSTLLTLRKRVGFS